MEKTVAREQALKIRKQLSRDDVSSQIVNTIIEQKILDDYDRIGIYYPLKEEIDLLPLISYYSSKTFCLPKTKEEIEFHRLESINAVVKGKFGVYEPVKDDLVVPQIILVPCVSVNKGLFRLGYGKGYYDRYFARHLVKNIGICYKECLLDFIEDDFDVKLDSIIVR